jgi:K(+)-stimulated pyrophosphate-energized sodium pump
MNFIIVSIIAGILALLTALFLSIKITRQKIENPVLSEIAFLIQEGAMAFLKKEYTILSIFVIAMFVIISVFIDFNILNVDKIKALNSNGNITSSGPWTAISYLFGAIGSALAGFIGMSIAVRGNSRTAEAAQKGLNSSLRVAFNTGTVMGMTVVGIGIIGVSILWLVFGNINIIAGFGFGASSIALFARVGGGIYTKAADVGADLVGKVEAGIPEDDPRNPATIADNVGDNVGDVAGMGADLFESYAGSIIATIALALFTTLDNELSQSSAIIFPILIGGIGIFSSIIGTLLVRTKPNATMSSLLWSLRIGIFVAGILSLIGTYIATIYLDIDIYYFYIIVIGLVVGQVIGTATEYFTSYEYSPVKWIAKQSLTGHPSNIIAGIAVGLINWEDYMA